jgi:hypothetical protein
MSVRILYHDWQDIKRFGKEAGARDGKSSFDVMVYSIRKFLRNLRPSTVSKERQVS